ncbi:MAG: hypothetical protein JJE35_03020 [Thermoleophilia bacterium]|nr:hypothetical protein [Thermoleophilia bacterium]
MRGFTRPLRAAGLLLALALAGCGSDTSYDNKPRPPEPIVVSASISTRSVSVSPTAFGGGPITIVITNQSDETQQLTVETAGAEAGITQKTGPINPGDTASMKLLVTKGLYRVSVSGDGIKPGRLAVGSSRPSSQNDVLQP